MSGRFWVLQVLNGVTFGGLLLLIASGFTLIFGTMRIVNLTHGVLYLLGGYLGLSVIRQTGSFLFGILVGAIAIGVLGLALERTLIRRMSGNTLGQVLMTIGIAFIFADLALLMWGSDPRTVPVPEAIRGSLSLGIVSYPRFRLFTLLVAVLITVGLAYLKRRTRWGAVIRAGVDDPEMVSALGINLPRVLTSVFVLGAALAGMAGVLGGAFLGLYRGADSEILLFGLVVVIIGGMGSLAGAVIGSFAVGLLDAFGTALYPDIAYFTLFGPMAVMLAVLPTGLLGKRT